MSNVPNNNNKIQIEAVRFRSAGSESTMQSIGGAANQLFDDRDAEITNRTAADTVLQNQINTNTSNISTVTGRVNNAKNIVVSYSTPVFPGVGQLHPADFWIRDDAGTWQIWKTDTLAITYSQGTLVLDTGVAVAANTIAYLTFGSTGAQYRPTIHVLTYSAV